MWRKRREREGKVIRGEKRGGKEVMVIVVRIKKESKGKEREASYTERKKEKRK